MKHEEIKEIKGIKVVSLDRLSCLVARWSEDYNAGSLARLKKEF